MVRYLKVSSLIVFREIRTHQHIMLNVDAKGK